MAEGRRELRDAPAQRPEEAEAARGVEQHADRGERTPRRALAEREEDPRVRALERPVEEAPRLREVEGRARLRKGGDRAHRAPGPWQRVLVPGRQDPPDPLTLDARPAKGVL